MICLTFYPAPMKGTMNLQPIFTLLFVKHGYRVEYLSEVDEISNRGLRFFIYVLVFVLL